MSIDDAVGAQQERLRKSDVERRGRARYDRVQVATRTSGNELDVNVGINAADLWTKG